MYDNRFFDFMMQNEALKKTMLLNKVALIIFEAFRMWQETMGDIFPPNVPSNVPSNVNSARIDCYANILLSLLPFVLLCWLLPWLLAGLRMMSLARMLLVMFTRPAENLSPKER